MTRKNSYTYEELLECARGNLFGPGNAQLPLPPMLMFDRIVNITEQGGSVNKGAQRMYDLMKNLESKVV